MSSFYFYLLSLIILSQLLLSQSTELKLIQKQQTYYFVNQDDVTVLGSFDYAFPFSKNLACVMKNGRYYYINKDGKKKATSHLKSL